MTKLYEIKQHLIPDRRKKSSLSRLGFYAPEVTSLVYALFTVAVILFTWTRLDDPQALLWQRLNFLSGTLALWVVHKLWPCRAVNLLRVVYLLIALMWWYPDTYELNRQFGNLDHIVATWEQDLFSMQPALLFSQLYSSKVVSELMYFGYFSYYFFFILVPLWVYVRCYDQFERVTLIIFGSFFICYALFVLMPVTGPQYYYPAVGTDLIAGGAFPNVGDYFRDHSEAIKSPGWDGGFFYNLIQCVHAAGERPTAAFPSSHVGIATVVMLILLRLRMWRFSLILAVPYIFLCLSTVYIMAHYAVDAFAGLLAGIVLFLLMGGLRLQPTTRRKRR